MKPQNHTLSAEQRNIATRVMLSGPLTAKQIAESTGIYGTSLGGHLAHLSVADLVRRTPKISGHPRMYWVRPDGFRAVEEIDIPGVGAVDLVNAGVNISSFCQITRNHPLTAHTELCGELAAALIRAEAGVVLGERMLRLLENVLGTSLGTSDTGHCPDVVLLRGDGKPVCYEVECSDKAGKELDPILRGWGRSALLERVLYLTTSRKATQVVAKHVRTTGTGSMIKVIPAEGGELPSAAALIPQSSRRQEVAHPHNQSSRPRTVRAAGKPVTARR
jgi:hypothetical protein